MSFSFAGTEILHSNLGGKGPDTSAPPTIRFVNVASFALPQPNGALVTTYVDLEVSARSDYTPYDAALNTLGSSSEAGGEHFVAKLQKLSDVPP